ncbi:lipopolysaccharide biosynthesis protein [Rhizobium rhizoryzae]|uniref:PST family polysaccharide transporter n=1 Tax=Rhizobium rhizoryzae TaxID=451876 RepID=A0A7W6LKR6_9HYPH|nr:lipopolysaccharide biosynthesis protein [Rhizobium rhizoryzae]MBB4146199.1 PST family polysaccharide transporter [Rhizobium rhizoryzae]
MILRRINWLEEHNSNLSIRKEGMNSFLWLTSAQVFRISALLVSTILLSRMIPKEDFGIFAMSATLINFINIFRDAGMSNSIIQAKIVKESQVSTIFWLNIAISLSLSSGVLILSFPIAHFYNQPNLIPLISVLAIGIFASGAAVQHDALLRRAMMYRTVSVLDIISTGAAGICAILIAQNGGGWWALVAQKVIQILIYTAFVWMACDWRPRFLWSWQDSRVIANFGAQISIFNFVNYFSRNGDNILIGSYWGPALLGVYAKSYETLLGPLIQIANPLANTLLPILSRLTTDPERYRATLLFPYKAAILCTLPAGMMMLCLPEATVYLIFGSGWEEAVPVLQWLGIAVATQIAGSASGTAFISQKRGRDYIITGLFCSVISILSFCLGLPFGIGSVAMVYSLMYVLVQQPFIFWMVGREGPVTSRDMFSLLGLPFICSLFSVPSLLAVRAYVTEPESLTTFFVGCLTSVFVQTLVLLAIPSGRNIMRVACHSFMYRKAR